MCRYYELPLVFRFTKPPPTVNKVSEEVYLANCHLGIINIFFLSFLLYKAEKPSVRLSDRHADISAVYASIETRLARNES